MQLAHEVREVSRERGRNEVGECGPQPARKRERELHSVERYMARTTHRDRSPTRSLPRAVSRPVRMNAGAGVSFRAEGKILVGPMTPEAVMLYFVQPEVA